MIQTLLLLAVLGASPAQATYRVTIREGGGVIAHGTGTAISERHVVTNSHVIGHQAGNRCTVVNSHGQHAGVVIAAAPDVDLAIVSVASGGLSYVPLASADPKAGEKVTIYGYGMSGVLRGGSGTVRPIKAYRAAGCPLIETDMGIESGDSGSGMFNAKGELCAVQWCCDSVTSASGATPISCLQPLTEKWEAQYCPNGQCRPLPWSNRYSGIGIVGPRGGAIGIGSVTRPLVPVQPRPPVTQPPPPTQPPQSNLEAILIRIEDRLTALELRKPEQGLPGVPGRDGADGQPGQQGMPGVPGRTPQIDYDAIADAVILRLPPQQLDLIMPDGTVQSQTKPLGQPLRLRLENVKVQAPN